MLSVVKTTLPSNLPYPPPPPPPRGGTSGKTEGCGELVVEGTQHGHASLDPVLLGTVAGDLHREHKVGGVARGGQSTCT